MSVTSSITPLPRDDNRQPIYDTYRNIDDGSLDVTTAGTAVPFSSTDQEVKKMDIQAKYSNTDMVVVGASTVVAAAATRRGVAIAPGQTITIYPTNLADVYLDAVVNGEGVTYAYYY